MDRPARTDDANPDERLHVTFICTGNICRSVIAEKLFAAQIRERGLEDSVRVSSAGIAGWFAHADPHALAVLAAHGYPTPRHRPTRVTREHLGADLVVAMARRHAHALTGLLGVPAERVRVLRSFDPTATALDVADPFGGTAADFERAYGVIAAALPGLHRWIDARLKTNAA